MVKYMQKWYVVALNVFPHTVHTQKDTPLLNLQVYHTVFEQSWIHRHAELLGMPWLWLYASHAHWTCKHSQKSPALYGCQSGSLNDFNANPPNNRLYMRPTNVAGEAATQATVLCFQVDHPATLPGVLFTRWVYGLRGHHAARPAACH